MPTLRAPQLDTLKHLIDEREATLRNEIRAADAAAAERPEAVGRDVGDAVDQGDGRVQEGLAHVDKLRDQEELMAIHAARGRIAEGSYGECIDCGCEIPLKRLQAQPTALRCVPCQARHEKSHPAAPLFSV